MRNADAVAFANDWRGIHNYDQQILGLLSVAREGEDAVVGIVGVDPLEPLPIEIDFMQRGLRGEQFI